MSNAVQYPRSLAVQVITRVLSKGEPLDDVLNELGAGLAPTQNAWLQEVCSGVLRWKGRLDLALDSLSLKKKPSGWLRKVLLMGAYQLIGQERTPAALAANETVSLVRKKEGALPAKFANALLRRLSEQSVGWRDLAFPPTNRAAQASWASLPDWMWDRLVKQQGEEWARAFATACLERPVLWLRAKNDSWKAPDGAEKGPVSFSWASTTGGNPTQFSGFREGEFIIQDISSQILVSEMAGIVAANSKDPKSIRTLDLCAAPGGKAVALSWLGFQVSATDLAHKRMKLLRDTVARTAQAIRVVDRESVAWNEQDWIWIDAPCTGSGIIRRHPDVRWLRKESDLKALAETQAKLLQEAFEKAPAGSFISYSVCSVLEEEGPAHLEALGLVPNVVRTWSLAPHLDSGGDGFWAVLLRKN